jgi:hypothetical protein
MRPGAGRKPHPTRKVRVYEEDLPRLDASKRAGESAADVLHRALDSLERQENPPPGPGVLQDVFFNQA